MTSPSVSDAYSSFGRHTEAGKLVYAIYNAQNSRRAYQPNVRIRSGAPKDPHEEHLKSLKPEYRRVHVKVPKPVNRSGSDEDCARFPMGAGRRTARDIQVQMKIDFDRDKRRPPLVHPRKPREEVIRDLQKQFAGNDNDDEDARVKRNRSRRTGSNVCWSPREGKLQLRSAIITEIKEREEFLKQMASIGEKSFLDVAPVIAKEIDQRRQELCDLKIE
ncbi:hypothetical protein PBRA_007773 [Plasmodiophora brassicae]|uniref:Uncharacterized protein n=1 Tax=Plasmodiophora brassicae TaxID=37360 RepID=A0A0G4IY14_PLABS|nr:hypothetical protein PBRA_007773 [Plasmodiophora brassicae]